MVERTIQAINKVEHEIEHLADSQNGTQDALEKEVQETKKWAEHLTMSAVTAGANWGKQALNKAIEHVEDIEL